MGLVAGQSVHQQSISPVASPYALWRVCEVQTASERMVHA